MELINESDTRGSCSALKITLLLIFVAFVLMSGCNGSETIWSAEAKSPDGKVVASARAILRNKGLSIISGIDTDVYLNWAADKRPPMLILNLADGSDAPSDTNVEMKWLTPTQLELTYTGNRSLGFQAVKWAGVDISVRDLSKATEPGIKDRRSLPTPPPFAYQKTPAPRPSYRAVCLPNVAYPERYLSG